MSIQSLKNCFFLKSVLDVEFIAVEFIAFICDFKF
jgi:hypothetical protein